MLVSTVLPLVSWTVEMDVDIEKILRLETDLKGQRENATCATAVVSVRARHGYVAYIIYLKLAFLHLTRCDLSALQTLSVRNSNVRFRYQTCGGYTVVY